MTRARQKDTKMRLKEEGTKVGTERQERKVRNRKELEPLESTTGPAADHFASEAGERTRSPTRA